MHIPLVKVDEERRLVVGRAAEEIADKSREIMDYATARPAFQKWSDDFVEMSGGKSRGNLRVMHGPTAAGLIKELTFDDAAKAVDIVAHVADDNEWRKVLAGVYNGFSIGGGYAKRWQDGELTRYTPRISEISLVDNPCIPTARFFDLVKMDGTIERREFVLPDDDEVLIKKAIEAEEDQEGDVDREKVHRVMSEFKAGRLKSSSGELVTDRRQAIAIALSEGRRAAAGKSADAEETDVLLKASIWLDVEDADELAKAADGGSLADTLELLNKAIIVHDAPVDLDWLAKRAPFREEEHPRDPDGQFADKPGVGDDAPKAPKTRVKRADKPFDPARYTAPKAGFRDVAGHQKANPRRDWSKVPKAEALKGLKAGDRVLVSAPAEGEGGERFWVQIDQVQDGKIYGRVANALYRNDLHGLRMRNPVIVDPGAVYDIWPGKAPFKTETTQRQATQAANRPRPDPETVSAIMREYKAGTLKSSSGKTVTTSQQALAIALEQGRKAAAMKEMAAGIERKAATAPKKPRTTSRGQVSSIYGRGKAEKGTRIAELRKAWEESKHPRDADGQFTSSSATGREGYGTGTAVAAGALGALWGGHFGAQVGRDVGAIVGAKGAKRAMRRTGLKVSVDPRVKENLRGTSYGPEKITQARRGLRNKYLANRYVVPMARRGGRIGSALGATTAAANAFWAAKDPESYREHPAAAALGGVTATTTGAMLGALLTGRGRKGRPARVGRNAVIGAALGFGASQLGRHWARQEDKTEKAVMTIGLRKAEFREELHPRDPLGRFAEKVETAVDTGVGAVAGGAIGGALGRYAGRRSEKVRRYATAASDAAVGAERGFRRTLKTKRPVTIVRGTIKGARASVKAGRRLDTQPERAEPTIESRARRYGVRMRGVRALGLAGTVIGATYGAARGLNVNYRANEQARKFAFGDLAKAWDESKHPRDDRGRFTFKDAAMAAGAGAAAGAAVAALAARRAARRGYREGYERAREDARPKPPRRVDMGGFGADVGEDEPRRQPPKARAASRTFGEYLRDMDRRYREISARIKAWGQDVADSELGERATRYGRGARTLWGKLPLKARIGAILGGGYLLATGVSDLETVHDFDVEDGDLAVGVTYRDRYGNRRYLVGAELDETQRGEKGQDPPWRLKVLGQRYEGSGHSQRAGLGSAGGEAERKAWGDNPFYNAGNDRKDQYRDINDVMSDAFERRVREKQWGKGNEGASAENRMDDVLATWAAPRLKGDDQKDKQRAAWMIQIDTHGNGAKFSEVTASVGGAFDYFRKTIMGADPGGSPTMPRYKTTKEKAYAEKMAWALMRAVPGSWTNDGPFGDRGMKFSDAIQELLAAKDAGRPAYIHNPPKGNQGGGQANRPGQTQAQQYDYRPARSYHDVAQIRYRKPYDKLTDIEKQRVDQKWAELSARRDMARGDDD